jgi:hypothetical protein
MVLFSCCQDNKIRWLWPNCVCFSCQFFEYNPLQTVPRYSIKENETHLYEQFFTCISSVFQVHIDTCLTRVFQVSNLPFTKIIGLVASTERIYSSVVQEWLTHPDVINLELTPIANWHEHGTIKTFLDESALAEAPAPAPLLRVTAWMQSFVFVAQFLRL